MPKLKPLQYYLLLSDLAALYWEAGGPAQEEQARELESEISTTLTGCVSVAAARSCAI